MTSRENYVYFAKLAEQAGRYEDMTKWMKLVVESNQELDCEERILFSTAYKHSMGSRRLAWRSI